MVSWKTRNDVVDCALLDFETYEDMREFFTARDKKIVGEIAMIKRTAGGSTTVDKYRVFRVYAGLPYPPGVPTYGKRYVDGARWMLDACRVRYDINWAYHNHIFRGNVVLERTRSIMREYGVDDAMFLMSCVDNFYRLASKQGMASLDSFITPLCVRRVSVLLTRGHACASCEDLSEWESGVDGDAEERELARLARDVETEGNRKRLREAQTELEDYDAETKRFVRDLDLRKRARVEVVGRVTEWLARNV